MKKYNMWNYKIFNNPKILPYAVIRNSITGISLHIPYKELATFSPEGAKTQIEEITNKLNLDVT